MAKGSAAKGTAREVDSSELQASAARFPVLAQDTLYQRIANHVRELIETEQLRPGEQLPPERALAEMLGVSRVPIREAMRTLAAQGLIEIRRGHGMFVAPRSIEAAVQQLTVTLLHQRGLFQELFAVRRLLEPPSARWAATSADRDGCEKLERIVAGMEAAGYADPPDYDAFADRDAQLHVEIAACSENRVLLRLMQAVQDIHREQLETSLRYQGRVRETIADHKRIVEAIALADPVEAERAMNDHLTRSEAATLARLGGNDSRQGSDALA